MPQQLRCSRGHQWEAPAPHFAGRGRPALCPVCGERHSTVAAPVPAADAGATVDFPSAIRRPTDARRADRGQGAPPTPPDPEPTMASLSAVAPPDQTMPPQPAAASPDHTVAPPPSLPGHDGTLATADPNATVAPVDARPAADSTQPCHTGPKGTDTADPDRHPGTVAFVPLGGRTEGHDDSNDGAPTAHGTAMYVRADAAHSPRTDRHGDSPDATRAREDFGGPTQRPSVAPSRPAELPAMPGAPTVPGYRILGVLGRGAMGVVYRAQQVGLNRVVALKMILSGEHAGERELVRFRVEAEAVAKLQHPSIVQVYEINSHDGRPYVALEFVDGGPLDKKLRGDPQPFKEAAELVRKLSEAMDYAHKRQIIHRDLKPANILLTADGLPKVTDFGLAKKLDDESSQTQSGAIMGTPNYMAPEQASGRTRDIGPAADVYALGAMLYETLVGRPPFKGQTVLETLEQVNSQEPTPPSRLRPKTPRDLETICLKCLQKEAGKRYASAGALAEDLRRFVAGEPILARPAPAWERAWKWVRRHPVPAALAAVCVLFVVSLVVGGVAFGLYQRGQAQEQARLRGVAEREHQTAEANFKRAEQNYGRARSAVDQMLTEVGQERLAREPRMEKLRRELLTRALVFYKLFLEEKTDDPGVRWETGRAQQRVGDIQEMLGDRAAAEESYAAARSLFSDLQNQFPDDPRYRQDLAACLNNLGQLFKDAGRIPEAEQALRDALALRQKLVDEAGRAEDRRELAAVAGNLGVLVMGWGRYAEAETDLRQSLQVRQALADESDAAPARLELARGQNDLGVLLAAVGRGDDAEQSFGKALEILRRLKDEQPSVPDYRQELAVGYNHLGNLWRDTKPQKAEEYYRECLDIRTALAADFPTTPLYRQEQAAGWHSLGFAMQAAGRRDDADKAYAKALQIEEKLVADYPGAPDYPFGLAGSCNNRAILLHTNNRLPEAEKLYNQADGLLEKLVADHSDAPAYQAELADVLQNLGVLCLTTNRPEEAAKDLGRSLDLRRTLATAYPKNPGYEQDLANARLNLGVSWQMGGKPAEAEASYREAVERFSALAGKYPSVPDYRHLLADALNNLGNLQRDLQHGADAEQSWRQAASLLGALKDEEPSVPAYRQELARGLNETGIYLASAHRADEAEKAWAELLPLQERLAADFPQNPVYREELAKYHGNLGVLYAQTNRLNLAEASYRRAAGLLEELEKEDPNTPAYWQDLIAPYANLASLLTASGTSADEAEAYWRRLAAEKGKLADAYASVAALQSDCGATESDFARFLRGRRKPEGARDALREAEARQQTARKLDPKNAAYSQRLCVCQLDLARGLLDLNDHAAAADAIARLSKSAPNDWPDWRLAAAVLARAAGAALADEKLAADRREELARTYGDEAMDLLRRAAGRGFKDAGYLAATRDFDPLRSREDFRKLTADWQEK